MRRKNDILWKVILEEVFDDLLRFAFPEAEKVFNLKRGFEFMDKELARMNPMSGKIADSRAVNKLVKVYRKDGGSEWILVHVEVQGITPEKAQFAGRMLRYFIRIFERSGNPVTALAIFTGPDAKGMPSRYDYECLGTRLSYEYNTLSILDFSDHQLDQNDNPFAVVLRAAKAALLEGKRTPEQLLDEKVLIAKRLFAKGFSKQKIKAIFAFLEGYIRLKNPGMNRTFRRRIEPQDKMNIMGIDEYLKQVGMEKGLAKGRREGREAERRAVVQNLVTSTNFGDEKIASLANVSADHVKTIRATMQSK